MNRAVMAMLLAVMFAELARQSGILAGLPVVQTWLPRLLVVGTVVLAGAARRLGLREAYLISLSLGLSVLVWWLHPDRALLVYGRGLDQGAYLMCFIMALSLLHEAAATSPAVAESGIYLTRQPPGRRYSALFTGSGLMSVLFNLGTVSFLVPLVQRGIREREDDGLNPVRQRRQISALLRGFAWAVIWSPTAIAPLVVARLIPGVERGRWLVTGLAVYVLVLVIGALEDRLRFRHLTPRAMGVPAPQVPWRAMLRFGLACLWLFGAAAGLAWLSGRDLITGLLIACPVMLPCWLAVQLWPGSSSGPQVAARLADQLSAIGQRLPGAAGVAVTLAGSGYVGNVAADLIPAAALARVLGLGAMPDFVLLALIPAALTGLSMLALSPVMTAVFFGGLFGSLLVLPADPTLLVFAISCGWALSMCISPVATPVLMINRTSGLAPRAVSYGWNAMFGLLAWLALWPVFWVLTGGQ